MNHKHISKLLSLVLRHQPEVLGITLDQAGWTSVATLLEKMQEQGISIDLAKLQEVVISNDKQRFAFSADGTKIRANQGHSIQVELGLKPLPPPAVLYHGTAIQHVPAILKEGLQRKSRQYVHLSPDTNTALKVGSRHGQAVVLRVHSGKMHRAGYAFYCSANGVWLTATVPAAFIETFSNLL